MRLFAILLPSLLFIGLSACEHPIGIIGSGDVLSASGERNCSSFRTPCVNTIVNAYEETYFAQPFSSNAFVGWDNCGSEQSNICSWSVAAEDVKQFWGESVAPMIARFEPVEEHGMAGVWLGSYAVNDGSDNVDAICQISGTLIMACTLLPANDQGVAGLTMGNLRLIESLRTQYSGRIYSPPWVVDSDPVGVIESFQSTIDFECISLDCIAFSMRIENVDGNSLTLSMTRNDELSTTDTSFIALAGGYSMTDPVGENGVLTVFEFIQPIYRSRQCRSLFGASLNLIDTPQDGINVHHFNMSFVCGDTQFAAFGLVSLFKPSAPAEFSGRALFTGITHNRQFTRDQSEIEIAREGTAQANSVLGEFDAQLAIDGSSESSWFSAGPGAEDATFTWTGVQGDFITSVTLVGNANNADPEARLGVGFGAVRIQVLNDGQVVSSTLRGMGGTPDPDTVAELNVFGDQVRLIFKGHEDISRGGFSELRINVLR